MKGLISWDEAIKLTSSLGTWPPEGFIVEGEPVEEKEDPVVIEHKGTQLWDHYVAHALSGLCVPDGDLAWTPTNTAEIAAEIADSMLVERKKRGIASL